MNNNTFDISTVRLMPFAMLCQEREAPQNLQSPNMKGKMELQIKSDQNTKARGVQSNPILKFKLTFQEAGNLV